MHPRISLHICKRVCASVGNAFFNDANVAEIEERVGNVRAAFPRAYVLASLKRGWVGPSLDEYRIRLNMTEDASTGQLLRLVYLRFLFCKLQINAIVKHCIIQRAKFFRIFVFPSTSSEAI